MSCFQTATNPDSLTQYISYDPEDYEDEGLIKKCNLAMPLPLYHRGIRSEKMMQTKNSLGKRWAIAL
ncbi:MAG: hypothetical protein ACRC6M_19205 [Microcystaceae cyanobacterium]